MKKASLIFMMATGLGLAGCANGAPEAASPRTTAATTSPTADSNASASHGAATTAAPISKPIATTGSYEADVTKLGIKPDNMQSYASWMKEQICEQDRTGLGIAVRSIGGGTPADGGGIEVVRLTNAYFCPTKTQEIEAELEYFGK
ncbi:hypothetical protein R5O87_17715 [Arthrobacter globiformis]|uniref:hypothetical protein n=1 Tax=Arthrobacter globiformis TaxID=1665 RepID=UPI00397C81EC